MMKRYVAMYVAWIAGVLTMALIAVAWYRHVEQIGVRALADRLASREDATEATEATDGATGIFTPTDPAA